MTSEEHHQQQLEEQEWQLLQKADPGYDAWNNKLNFNQSESGSDFTKKLTNYYMETKI